MVKWWSGGAVESCLLKPNLVFNINLYVAASTQPLSIGFTTSIDASSLPSHVHLLLHT